MKKMKICICVVITLLMIASFSMMQVEADYKPSFDTQTGQPIQSAPFPGNNTGCTNTSVRLYITANDPAGDEMNITWLSNSSGSWEAFGWNSSINNGTYSQIGTNFTAFNTTYYTNISIDNGTTGWSNVTYSFRTMANATIYVTTPTNGSTSFVATPTIHIDTNDSCGNAVDVFWYENSTGAWVLVQTNSTVTANDSVYYTYDNATNWCTIYGWMVAVNNSFNNISDVFWFSTASMPATIFSYQNPINGSLGQEKVFTWNTTIESASGEYFNWTINCSSGDNSSSTDASNGSKTLDMASLNYCTNYTVWVNTTNNCSNTTNEFFYFVTRNSTNTTLSFPNPVNGTTNRNLSLNWNITMTSPDGEYFQYWINCSNAQTATASSQTNGSKTLSISGLENVTSYYVFVNVTNNCSNWTREYFNFSTKAVVNIISSYPVNESTGNTRPPVNISALVNGTLINITYNYYNMTPWPHVFSQLYQWTNRNSGRYVVPNLGASGNWSNSFIWGNTNYQMTINITEGANWSNSSYWYNTTGSRYDVTNSGDVISTDVSATWSQRQGVAPYDGIYDTDQTGDVVSNDLSLIWNNRT